MIEMKKMQEKMTVYKEKRRQDLKKLQNVDTIIEDREKEILDLKKRVSDYETGVYGLETAVREIKDLRIQKNLRDKEIVELTKSINDYEKQAQEFIEENMELRRRLGLDETSAIDISNLKSKKLLDYVKSGGGALHAFEILFSIFFHLPPSSFRSKPSP